MILQIDITAAEARDPNYEGTVVRVVISDVGPERREVKPPPILLTAIGTPGEVGRYVETCVSGEIFDFAYGPKVGRTFRSTRILRTTEDPR